MKLPRLATALLLFATSAAAQGGAVIVSKASTLMTMSNDDARRVLLGLQSNVAEQTITVVFQRSEVPREEFNSKVLGKTGSELTSNIASRSFAGRAVPPTEVM